MKTQVLSLQVFALIPCLLHAQEPDSLPQIILQDERIEFIAERTEREPDYAGLTDILEYHKENPININEASEEDLLSLQLLDPLAVRSLISYRQKYGALLTVYELLAIEGFNRDNIQAIMPYITLQPRMETSIDRNRRLGIRCSFIARYSRVPEKQQGYRKIPPEEWQENPNGRYIGSADRLYIKYILSWNNRLSSGFIMDKDAGEAMLGKRLPDTIADAVNNNIKAGFDFYSAYVFIKDCRFIKKIVIGDYHLQFGQGLTIWSGMGYGKSADAVNVKKYASMIRPNTSANENDFMRGGAAWIQFGPVGFIVFYSNHKADGNLVKPDTDTLGNARRISSFQGSGLHRTMNETMDKHAVRIVSCGGRIHYHPGNFKVGFSGHLTRLDASLDKTEQPYNLYEAKGKEFFNTGMDFEALLFGNTSLFGEISTGLNCSVALISGLVTMLHPKLTFAAVYRHYPSDHVSLYGNAFSECGSNQNESGLYLGVSVNLFPNTTIKAYADHYRFPWLRYRVNAPSSGHDMLLQMDHAFSPATKVYLRYRTETRQQNQTGSMTFIEPLIDMTRHILRLHLSCQANASLQLRSRIECNTVNAFKHAGFLIFQDINWKPGSRPYQLTTRFALFDADSYENRIYAYENDVLYSSSVPAYDGQGTRIYVIFNWKCTRFLELWLRIAQTYYYDRNVIGTGLDEIQGRTKSEIKIQVRVKI